MTLKTQLRPPHTPTAQLAASMFSTGLKGCRVGLLKLPALYYLKESHGISTELTTALRPFYFAVHPDLFGQHPLQRRVNEDSLKQLSAHMESIYEQKYHMLHEGRTLSFYIRDANASTRDTFKLIKITLDQRSRDPKAIIQRLLELCDLPTEYIKGVKLTAPKTPKVEPSASGFSSNFRPGQDYRYGAGFAGFDSDFSRAKETKKQTLYNWIRENGALGKSRAQQLAGVKEEVAKLQKSVMERLGMLDVRYDCGWNFEHYRGCLKTLERMANLHEQHMDVLKGRVVVFAPFTGVSLEGHIMLFTGDVLNNWIDFIRNIPKHDEFLKKVPFYEKALSQVLRNIKIGRRKFMPKQQAMEYAAHLTKVTTTLGDYLTVNRFPKTWPETLSDFEIVIESEAGPLMVSPTGQLIAPATCPGFMLIDFITTNLALATERTKKYREQKHVEKELVARGLYTMKLQSLTKDDSVTPDKMIEALTALLKNDVAPFQGLDLHITTYYSVLSDGKVCIPWDFNTR